MSLAINTTQPSRDPIPEGVYESVISEMAEATVDNRRWKTKPEDPDEKQVISMSFEILEGESAGRRMRKNFTPTITYSGTKPSNLAVMCESLMGRKFTPEELASIGTIEDLQKMLLNKPVQIIIKHSTSQNGNLSWNIISYMKSKYFGKEMPKRTTTQYSVADQPQEPKTQAELDAIFPDQPGKGKEEVVPEPPVGSGTPPEEVLTDSDIDEIDKVLSAEGK